MATGGSKGRSWESAGNGEKWWSRGKLGAGRSWETAEKLGDSRGQLGPGELAGERKRRRGAETDSWEWRKTQRKSAEKAEVAEQRRGKPGLKPGTEGGPGGAKEAGERKPGFKSGQRSERLGFWRWQRGGRDDREIERERKTE